MDKILSNIAEIYLQILETKLVLEQTEKPHLFNGAYCKWGGGPREHAKLNLTDWTGRNAWDIEGSEGTSVNAIDGGTVSDVQNKTYNKEKSEYGASVIIKTDNDTHYYTHLSSIGPKIKRGAKILQGDLIGKIGKPKEEPNWPSHVHISLERGNISSFLDNSCNLIKKGLSGKNISSGTTNSDELYTKTGIGKMLAGALKLESSKKRKLNEVTLMAPVPIKPNFKGNFAQVRKGGYVHPGTDIAVPSGTPVKAPLSGKVVNIKANQHPCGGTIDIDYGNGLWSRFCHIKQIDVKEGDVVERGQVVGRSGGGSNDYGKGRSSGPHLHFTLKKDGKNVDPADYMEKYSTTDVVFDKSDSKSSTNSSDAETEIDYKVAKNSISNLSSTTQKNSERLYDKTGIGDLFLKPLQALGLGEGELEEDKIYGEFGKEQETKYGSITLPKDKNSKIKSPVSGKIVRGNYNPDCDNQINIEHEVDGKNYILEYCGITKPNVNKGQQISVGTILGLTDKDITISLFDDSGRRVYIDNYIKKEVDKTKKFKKNTFDKQTKLYDSPWGQVVGSILASPFKLFQDKYDESGELKQKRWSSPTEKTQPDDWISQMSPTYPKKLKEEIERIKKML